MNDMAEQYSKMVECATDLTEFFLDQDGGAFALTVVYEMLQILTKAEEQSAASLVLETICLIGDIKLPLEKYESFGNSSFNLGYFVELIEEALET